MNKQQGFSIVEIGAVLAVVLVVGTLGFVFYNKWLDGTTKTETAQTATSEVADAQTITSTEDLAETETMLDGIDLADDGTLEDLDADLASF